MVWRETGCRRRRGPFGLARDGVGAEARLGWLGERRGGSGGVIGARSHIDDASGAVTRCVEGTAGRCRSRAVFGRACFGCRRSYRPVRPARSGVPAELSPGGSRAPSGAVGAVPSVAKRVLDAAGAVAQWVYPHSARRWSHPRLRRARADMPPEPCRAWLGKFRVPSEPPVARVAMSGVPAEPSSTSLGEIRPASGAIGSRRQGNAGRRQSRAALGPGNSRAPPEAPSMWPIPRHASPEPSTAWPSDLCGPPEPSTDGFGPTPCAIGGINDVGRTSSVHHQRDGRCG